MKNIVYNDVIYTIDGNKLIQMEHKGEAIDVLIPHKFPSGEVITTIKRGFCNGVHNKYNKITIDDSISVIEERAFNNSSVVEVVWPAACDSIPKDCFAESAIEKLSNINHITSIGNSAFFWSSLLTFSWPKNCTSVPGLCFGKSALKTITGLDVVQEICPLAFFNVSPSEAINLSGCTSLALSENAFLGMNEDMVIPPYYISESDWEHAFNRQALKYKMPR